MNQRVVSTRFPYVPITITVGSIAVGFDALLDTGFEGALIAPRTFAATAGRPTGYGVFTLADGSSAAGPAFLGTVAIGTLGTVPIQIVALGDECLTGRELSDLFRIILDHGRQLIVEP